MFKTNRFRWFAVALATMVATSAVGAQQQQGATPDDATISRAIAAKAKGAKLNHAHARTASINGKKFNITPADFSALKSRDQLKDGVFLGVLDNEAGAADDVTLPTGTFNLYVQDKGGTLVAYAEQNGKIYHAKRIAERKDTPAGMEPKFSRGSGCWWLNLFITGVYVCW